MGMLPGWHWKAPKPFEQQVIDLKAVEGKVEVEEKDEGGVDNKD
jgi:hypothetical protein